jgi:hypothetical protein
MFRIDGDSSGGERAFENIDDSARETGRSFDKFTAGAVAAGAAAGVGLASAFGAALDIQDANAKLSAQLGLSEADAATAGAAAGDVYRAGWGESIAEVNETIRTVATNLGDVGDLGQDELTKLTTSAQILADTFGADVGESAKAAGILVKNGLAANSAEAFDILGAGFRDGADRGGDFLETISEYSPQFAKLGISGSQALALLEDGLQAGARDTDTIADAFKEFSLRAIDGSTGVAEGYKLIGLNAQTTAADVAAGGARANEATFNVLQGLNNMKDPMKQNEAGVALFGTQWEDTLRQILPSIAEMNDASDTVAGSIDGIGAAAGGSAKSQIESLKRGFSEWTQGLAESEGAMGLVVTGVGAFGGPTLEAASSVGMLVAGLSAFSATAAGARIAQLAGAAATGVATAAQWLWNLALSANPIGLLIIGIAALVAGLVWFFTQTEVGRKIFSVAMGGISEGLGWVWDKGKALFGWAKENWPLLLAIITGPIGLAVLMIAKHWDTITGGIQAAKSKISAIGSGMWDGIKNAFRGTLNFIIGGWNRLRFTVPGFSAFGVNVGGFSLGVPAIPYLARGAIATGPTLGVFGEAGTEALVPLDRADEFGFGGGGGPRVTVNVYAGAIGSERFLMDQVTEAVEGVLGQGGSSGTFGKG